MRIEAPRECPFCDAEPSRLKLVVKHNAQAARLWKRAVRDGMPCGAVVVLRAGYCMDSPALAVRLLAMDFRGKGEARHREWGEPLTSHFVLLLGTVLKQGDYSTVKAWCAAAADTNLS